MAEFKVEKGQYYMAECDSTHLFIASKDFIALIGGKRDMHFQFRYFDDIKNMQSNGTFAPNHTLRNIRKATPTEVETLNMWIVKEGYKVPEVEVKPNTEFKWF